MTVLRSYFHSERHISFVDSATGDAGAAGEVEACLTNPVERCDGKGCVEPLYRCRSLATVTPTLISAGRFDDALAAASKLDAARIGPLRMMVHPRRCVPRETERPEHSGSRDGVSERHITIGSG